MKKDYICSNVKLHYTIISGNFNTPLVLIHGQASIAHFLDTGEVLQEKACRKRTVTVSEITEDMLIEE